MRKVKVWAVLFLAMTARTGMAAEPAAAGGREHLSLDANWMFSKGEMNGAEAAGFEDKGWRKLDVPHDWSIEGPLDQANPSGGQGGFAPTGVGWYRRHFVTAAGWAGKHVSVTFDGVFMNADVYLNGEKLGHHTYGYTGFTIDLTGKLAEAGKENVLAVRVDNSVEPNSRWYTGSGIYRHVWMDVTGQVRLATAGIYATTPTVSASSAQVQVKTRVVNDSLGVQNVTVHQELLDPDGKVAGTADVTQPFNRAVAATGSEQEITQTITVPSPQLWSLDKPVMYSLKTVISAGGAVTDQAQTPIGIRDIQYDVNKGFLLNGQHVKMLGMCLHSDGGAFGAAVPEDVWERRLKILKSMGCNAVRCSHNPPAPEFLDLCDRLGVLVMDEAFDEWSVRKGSLQGSYSRYFAQESDGDIRAMLTRDRNHPSIVMWSIGNEIPQQTTQVGVDIAKRLAAICHEVDPTRPVTSACDNVHAPSPTWPSFIEALDIAGYNYVDRWNEHREIYFSDDREKYPARKFVGTEDVCVGGVRGSYFGGGGGFGGVAGRGGAAGGAAGGAPGRGGAGGGNAFGYASSMIRAEQLWKFNAVHDYVIGYFMWTGIDYLGEAGAWPRKGSSSGTIDTCGFPKDGYYFYQSQWTSTPMVHVMPHWNYPGEKGTVIPVVVYSNCPQVELVVNGKSYGTKSIIFPRPGAQRSWSDATPTGTTGDLHLTWDVLYEPGTVRAIGKRGGQVVVQEEVTTAGEAAAVGLLLDTKSVQAGRLAQIEARIVDDKNLLVPTANQALTFEVEGPGKVIAVDNGDQGSHESYQTNVRSAFNGMALAVVKAGETPGHVKVTAKAGGLKTGTVEFDVTAGAPVVGVP